MREEEYWRHRRPVKGGAYGWCRGCVGGEGGGEFFYADRGLSKYATDVVAHREHRGHRG